MKKKVVDTTTRGKREIAMKFSGHIVAPGERDFQKRRGGSSPSNESGKKSNAPLWTGGISGKTAKVITRAKKTPRWPQEGGQPADEDTKWNGKREEKETSKCLDSESNAGEGKFLSSHGKFKPSL